MEGHGGSLERTPLLTDTGSINSELISSLEAEEGVERNELGTVNGVYVPCLLNILGAVLFLRIGYAVGYAGLVGTVVIFVAVEVLALVTVLCFSGIVTNGKMAGGGAYYLISRSIGPAFGGATGIIFYACYALNACFQTVAFTETVVSTFFPHSPGWLAQVIYSGTLCVLLLVALGGAAGFAKVNTFLFFSLAIAIMITFGSMLFRTPGALSASAYPNATWSHPTVAALKSNLYPSFDDKNSLRMLVGLLFTSTCGIMEGANLSGDLKSPAKSLPKGTLYALLTSSIVYLSFSILLAACFPRDVLQNDNYVLQEVSLRFVVVIGVGLACLSTALGALFGGARILQAIARDHILPLGYFGKGTKKGDEPQRAVLATFVLAQALGQIGDLNSTANFLSSSFLTAYGLVCFSCFCLAITNTPNWRPRFKFHAWWLSLINFVALMALMWYLSLFFAAGTFAIWLVLFAGIAVTCSGDMGWGDISSALFYRITLEHLKKIKMDQAGDKFWRSSVLLLAEEADMPLVRFCQHLTGQSGLYLVGTALVHQDSQEGGGPDRGRARAKSLAVSPEGLLPRTKASIPNTKRAWKWLAEHGGFDLFPCVATAHSARTAYQNLVSIAGIGDLSPNMVVLPFSTVPYNFEGRVARCRAFAGQVQRDLLGATSFLEKKRRAYHHRTRFCGVCHHPKSHDSFLSVRGDAEFASILTDILSLEKNIVLTHNLSALDALFRAVDPTQSTPSLTAFPDLTIDIWIPPSFFSFSEPNGIDDGLALLLQCGHLLQQSLGKFCSLRVLQLQRDRHDVQHTRETLLELVKATRIDPPEIVLVRPGENCEAHSPEKSWFENLSDTVRFHSSHTALVVMPLPRLPWWPAEPTADEARAYMDNLRALNATSAPTVLVAKGEAGSAISFDI